MTDSSRRRLERSQSVLCPDTLCPDENKTLGLASLDSPVEIKKMSSIYVHDAYNSFIYEPLRHFKPL